MKLLAARDRLSLVREPHSGIEAIRARFHGHAYDMHHHDEWLVGVTLDGIQDFHCRRARRQSTPGRVILIEPGEMHDGRAGADDGFAYEMLYLPQGWLARQLVDLPDRHLGFRSTLDDDPSLARAIRRAVAVLGAADGRLVRDAALDALVDRLRYRFSRSPEVLDASVDLNVASRARDYLREHFGEDVGADGLAAAAGASSRFHLARSFRKAYATSPHAYLFQVRLVAARRLLAKGVAPAIVAADCGFADQSHLGRRFRSAFGMTPASYRQGRTEVPDAAFTED